VGKGVAPGRVGCSIIGSLVGNIGASMIVGPKIGAILGSGVMVTAGGTCEPGDTDFCEDEGVNVPVAARATTVTVPAMAAIKAPAVIHGEAFAPAISELRKDNGGGNGDALPAPVP